MKVTVIATEETGDGNLRVSFRCAYGHGHGYWVGEEPHPGEVHEVELAIDGEHEWGERLNPCEPMVRIMPADDDSGEIIVRAMLEDVEECFAVLRMGNTLLVVPTTGGGPGFEAFAELRTERLQLLAMPEMPEV